MRLLFSKADHVQVHFARLNICRASGVDTVATTIRVLKGKLLHLSQNQIWYGSEVSWPEPVILHAGPVSMQFLDGEIRHITIRDSEIINRIYVAVRSSDWRTIPSVTTLITKNISHDAFRVVFKSHHAEQDIDFSWQGSIVGKSSGDLDFFMEGLANSTFHKNRIGFCILHSTKEFVGKPCTIETVDGARYSASFPTRIAPHQVFQDIRAMFYEAAPQLRVELRFQGETFETEDQRNWAEASFKTYCTPLIEPYPVEIAKGTVLTQAISLSVAIDRPYTAPSRGPSTTSGLLQLEGQRRRIPKIGVACSSNPPSLSPLVVARLRAVGFSHLRFDLSISNDSISRLILAVEDANLLGVHLEVALFLPEDREPFLQSIQDLLKNLHAPIIRWLVFSGPFHTTTEADISLARGSLFQLAPGAEFGGGTDEDFAELNRYPLPVDLLDFVTFSMNPQVHTDDHETLVQSLPMQYQVVCAARDLSNGLPVHISPISLKPRYFSHSPASDSSAYLSSTRDPRQSSLFGAAWTVASLKNISQAGASSATYYETSGAKGVLATQEPSALPRQFPSVPGTVFPLFHVLSDFCEFDGGETLSTSSSNPTDFDGVALQKNGRTRVMLANLSARTQRVRVQGVPPPDSVRYRMLSEDTAVEAISLPEQFRDVRRMHAGIPSPEIETALPPFAVATLDFLPAI